LILKRRCHITIRISVDYARNHTVSIELLIFTKYSLE